ncbi:MAG: hypothetical protein EBU90_03490 [Proteobacteria bacterium]|nr:hypothetical protein [Pseudomonadota bacterium]NBP13389.1 hypothetical protein [bacterium]
MYNDISNLIKEVGSRSYPDQTYFSSFVSRYKMYRKAKIIKQRILASCGIIAFIIVAYLSHSFITKDRDVKSSYTTW